MTKYRLVSRAVAEVDDIAAFTAQRWGRAKSIEYIRDLVERFAWLAENPMLGRSRDELREGLRCYRQQSHVIFYRVVRDGIEIVGLPHASMDFEKYFGN